MLTLPVFPEAFSQDNNVNPGQNATIIASNFGPNSQLDAYFDNQPIQIYNGTTDENGNGAVQSLIPSNAAPGQHELLIRQKDAPALAYYYLNVTSS